MIWPNLAIDMPILICYAYNVGQSGGLWL